MASVRVLYISMRYVTTDVPTDETATPLRMSDVVGTMGPTRARPYASATAISAPANAAGGTGLSSPAVTNSGETMISVAPTLAPAATPMMYGSASGLRKTPWYAAPENASVAPT